jgi:8-oxo-dGTP pyrophosphatase MutT (NUDIX family)
MSRFAPELSYGRHYGPAPLDAKAAAVLLLCYPREGVWHIPLTVRPETMAEHAGQVSLPGGVIEPGESSAACALREYEEELGAPRERLELVGQLTPILVFVSNFHVTPWVAAAGEPPAFSPSAAEVAEVIELPLAALFDQARVGSHLITRRALRFRAPHWAIAGREVWGATSMILAELAAVLADLA